MSFLDKMTKAVGDVVDRGKKDVDQFMRIQKVNGEIGAIETKVSGLRTQVQQARQEAGARAVDLVKAGTLSHPDLQLFVERLDGLDRQIAVEEAAIADKKADIERIKAEHAAEHAASASAPAVQATPEAPPAVPVAPVAAAAASAPAGPPPAQPAGTCPQCGTPLTGGAFCQECGSKVG